MPAKLAELGLVTVGGRQRGDSAHVLAAVRTLNGLEFVAETLRAGLEARAAAAPQWLTTHVEPRCAGATDPADRPSHRTALS
ncbi:hypothetical protein ACU635_33475 [[Actinomadura] parvosata]|uniref:hypothetical protein n=1 Tax=[Actinomadura] parvosata TaxID=1955412 RepID=UPI00406C0FAF